jgi:hypothetical protein
VAAWIQPEIPSTATPCAPAARFGECPLDFSFPQELAQMGDSFPFKIVSAGTLEELLLRANYKGKLIVSMRLNFSDLPDQLNYGAPC